MSEEERTGIPIVTLARVFEDVSFKRPETRITANTLKLSSEYIRLFISEAIVRSNEERLRETDQVDQVDGIDNVQTSTAGHGTNANELADDDFDDFDEDDIDAVPDPNTQERAVNTGGGAGIRNNMLDTRHLAKVAGVLVLDF